ncbi:MAG: head GIN domain-containing protein [Draconibacterium sp.]|nr:head GIN domain-containing protein [Draconibacterium sp.]
MKTIKLFILGSFTLLFAATSCINDFTIRGNGIQATEGRIISGFDRVKSSGSFDVHITEGNEYEVIVSAEENIIPYIETYKSGDVLHIEIRGIHSVKNRLPMEVFVTTPRLEGVKLSGSGLITTGHFVSDDMDILLSGSGKIEMSCEAEEVDAKISGSGRIELSGFADETDFNISGSGSIEASNFETIDCYSAISGSGDVWIKIERFLKASISGSGNVFYYGNPSIETHISGSGNVINQN